MGWSAPRNRCTEDTRTFRVLCTGVRVTVYLVRTAARHVQFRRIGPYLVAAGCGFIQVDEPNYAMTACKHQVLRGDAAPMVAALNAALDGVEAKTALHVCFGNAHNNSFASPRRYRALYPRVLEARVSQFVFEYANREMSEIGLWSEFPTDKEVAVGVVDVKAFHVETPEEIAERVRLALKHIPAERLWLVPDCGLWETPRWVGVAKLRSMVEAARIVRRELGGS